MKQTITPLGEDTYDELRTLWEASVRSTHHFLSEADILFYGKLLRESYLALVQLYGIYNEEEEVVAFMGLSEEQIEMLFVHPDEQHKGYGTQLVCFALTEKQVRKVDVNEQNEAAYQFYRNMGFCVEGRDELDVSGRPFPILHLVYTD